jgi:DNA helicase II / ATP-dependent DNA helicase PcrA
MLSHYPERSRDVFDDLWIVISIKRMPVRPGMSGQVSVSRDGTPKVQTATTYLDTLNPEQRCAVEHGAAGGLPAPPLLVIAGAGSGKTNTLAHRVAHLIVQGADPRRILLMTFSRRAASEMTKRVERIARKVMGDNAGIMTDELTWAGTYHGIGARLLREYAEQIGLDPAFTIHDREDSADLMNLVRHEKGFSKTKAASPRRGPVFRSTRVASTPNFRSSK